MFNNSYYLTALHGFITGVFKKKKIAEAYALSASIFGDAPHIVLTVRGKAFRHGKLIKDDERAVQVTRSDGTVVYSWESKEKLDARMEAETEAVKKHAAAAEAFEKMILDHQTGK